MLISLRDGLPFTKVTVNYRGNEIEITDILIDTGSASTIISADAVSKINLYPLPEDPISIIRGVGGNEVVFSRRIDALKVGETELLNFDVEIGSMDYGFKISGIIGMDFLVASGALINLKNSTITFSPKWKFP
jgi:hypothetical protein